MNGIARILPLTWRWMFWSIFLTRYGHVSLNTCENMFTCCIPVRVYVVARRAQYNTHIQDSIMSSSGKKNKNHVQNTCYGETDERRGSLEKLRRNACEYKNVSVRMGFMKQYWGGTRVQNECVAWLTLFCVSSKYCMHACTCVTHLAEEALEARGGGGCMQTRVSCGTTDNRAQTIEWCVVSSLCVPTRTMSGKGWLHAWTRENKRRHTKQ